MGERMIEMKESSKEHALYDHDGHCIVTEGGGQGKEKSLTFRVCTRETFIYIAGEKGL